VDAGAAGRLLEWFAAARRELPWRGPFPRDPYRVLISEVMLQQTQVDRVVAGYARFLDRFPTLESLAVATEDEVVEAFSGMGYYGRARRLHQAATAIVERGSWPDSAAALAALPGLGPYTAAAVAAFAFGGDDPPVDGNVARITARVGTLALPLGSGRLLRHAARLARDLHAGRPEPGIFEALMELGATVCTPRAPRCGACPLAPDCAAAGAGDPERYPLPRPQREAVAQTWVALWLVRSDGACLLRRVDGLPVLAGLWLPPLAVVGAADDPGSAAATLAASVGYRGALERRDGVRHAITHRRITVVPFAGRWQPRRVSEPGADTLFRQAGDPGVPTSSLLAKLRRACSGSRQARVDDPWEAS
jgi:A/G-specific adenine glycosylase